MIALESAYIGEMSDADTGMRLNAEEAYRQELGVYLSRMKREHPRKAAAILRTVHAEAAERAHALNRARIEACRPKWIKRLRLAAGIVPAPVVVLGPKPCSAFWSTPEFRPHMDRRGYVPEPAFPSS